MVGIYICIIAVVILARDALCLSCNKAQANTVDGAEGFSVLYIAGLPIIIFLASILYLRYGRGTWRNMNNPHAGSDPANPQPGSGPAHQQPGCGPANPPLGSSCENSSDNPGSIRITN
ncbi:hypothetical protein DPMN_173518 [Dreissena polymorpha]|uniref:Uncharacterized protein n=1 Tax=Dreissena polymorpha TaxID=45954 RepID=A0A9D4E4F0_DREPO|nr:hypothetical protein DPMN_173518 [Dreissena polymorpha]